MFVVSIDIEAIFMTLSPLKFVMLALNKYCTNDYPQSMVKGCYSHDQVIGTMNVTVFTNLLLLGGS